MPRKAVLTAQQVEPVRHSFEPLRPVDEQAAARFYDKLLERAPALYALFHRDMAQQGERLMQRLDGAVRLIGRPCVLDEVRARLSERHAGHGARDAHHPTVCTALLDTLAVVLSDTCAPPVRQAWSMLLDLVSRVMRAGAAVAPGPKHSALA